jgi:phenylacetyl-CoA:acceptor oxidoreductase
MSPLTFEEAHMTDQKKPEAQVEEKWVPTYCYQCNAGGPDLLKVHVVNGVAVGIEPNFDFSDIHPGKARVCVKAQGLINKHYNPNRIKGPMKRTNPKKGVNEDPCFVEISWDEALNLWAEKLLEVRGKGLLDENGYPRVAYAEGSDGVCPSYEGTMPVIFGGMATTLGMPPGIWGPVDATVAQGGGVKCYHTEHIFGELWHKAFTCIQDTPNCKYLVVFGRNDSASGGVAGVYRQAEARGKGGFKRVQVEPHLSVSGATSEEWIPIKPETDHAFLYALNHIILYEMNWQQVCDIEFLKTMTNSPYLVAPNGYFLRDPETRKPLVWDSSDHLAKVFDGPVKDAALDGEFQASGITLGPDGKIDTFDDATVRPSFQLLRDHFRGHTPEWAAKICDVKAETIRKVATEFVDNAMVGATIKIDGIEMPLRPACTVMGKTQNNGWGGYQCVWASHVLQMLVGALEVPGGHLGNRVLFSGAPVKTLDGFMEYPFNPTDKEHWHFPPGRRDGCPSICPLTGPFLGPLHLAWKWLLDPPENWPAPSIPEVFITFKINPVVSQFDTPVVLEVLRRIPFHVSFAYTLDETVWFADLVLPEDTDLEALQIFPTGGTTFFEHFWESVGFAIKQPAVERQQNTRNMTDIATDLAAKLGMLPAYNEALNYGAYMGIVLKGTPNELASTQKYSAEEIYDRMCRALTRQFSNGQVEFDLNWFKENGGFFGPFPKIGPGISNGPTYLRPWYLFPYMKENGFRFELPYQERVMRTGEELRSRLRENNITWWTRQAEEYQALPEWHDISKILDEVTAKVYNKDPEDYPFWLIDTRSMQYAWGSNVGVPMLHEAASDVLGHTWLQMNAKTAKELQIKDGDEVWIESSYAKTKGRVKLREGIRPDVILSTQMYGQFKMPFAKDLKIPNLNQVAPALIELTDESGGSKDHVRVKIHK